MLVKYLRPGGLASRCLACLLLALLTACGGGGQESPAVPAGEASVAVIEGQVFYRERMMLPSGAEVEVQLQDISRADAMATVMASVLLKADSGPPYAFTIDYDPAQIDDRMRYALRATISLGDRLLFSSTDYIDPFGSTPVEVLVRRVAEPVSRDTPALEGTTWELQSLGDEPAPAGANGKPLDIQLQSEDARVAGFSGCNRYMGSYSREGTAAVGNPLSFGPLAGTMMACAEGGELERRYLQSLAGVTAFSLDGEVLSLLAGSETIATFVAR